MAGASNLEAQSKARSVRHHQQRWKESKNQVSSKPLHSLHQRMAQLKPKPAAACPGKDPQSHPSARQHLQESRNYSRKTELVEQIG